MGARVIAAASTQEGRLPGGRRGCGRGLYRAELRRDADQGAWRQRRVEAVFDAVGDAYAEPALRSIAWGGVPGGGVRRRRYPEIPLNLALLKGCDILGVLYGTHVKREPEANRALMAQLFDWIAAGALKPAIAHVWPLDRAAEALELLLARRVTGKIVLTT